MMQAAAGVAMTDPIRVLVCDDSSVVRSVLERLLRADASIRVVAKAMNGREAIAAVQAGGIDVVVLDIEMPVMDGLAALPRLLAADHAVKVLMASAMTRKGGAIALESLRLGASDFIPKPTSVGEVATDSGFRAELIAKVLGLGRQSRAYRARRGADHQAAMPRAPTAALRLRPVPQQRPAVLGIGSSTGGPAALLTLFQALGDRIVVPILLTQHMPAAFTPQLAEHINRLGGATCAEAVHGEPLRPGHVHLAPGNRHLTVVGREGGLTIALTDDPPENFCRPSVDPMLRSLSAAYPGRVLALMLTGMGQDGLRGAERIVGDGGSVIAQDEATSIVWGMPGAVARAGLCQAVLPLNELAPKLLQFVGRPNRMSMGA
jgi:two-component system, chemotaxis family, protein-glutamate methylesterase/glutaminase